MTHLKNLQTLDLEPIVIKAMDAEEGKGWDFHHACRIADEYRRFLTMCKAYPDATIVPSSTVDDFWHLHILDTQKYAEDCANYLGFFLHHFPYFGMRGKQDAQNLQNAWQETKKIYLTAFGVAPPADLWSNAQRCPNCGRRHTNASEQRPRFSDLSLSLPH